MQLKYKSIEELKATITIPDLSKTSIKSLINSMKTLSLRGTDRSNSDAKEEAYIYFYKYMLLFNHVHKSKEFKVFKNDLKDAMDIMSRLERLTKELTTHYDSIARQSREAELKAQQAMEAQLKKEEMLRNELNNKLSFPAQMIENRYWIGVQQLIDCIKSSNQKFSYIIWDTRPSTDYNDSHLKILHNVNIPMSEIPKGTSANALESKLPNSSQQEWKIRATYHFNILMGVDDSPDRISGDVQQLYDIISKWDPNTTYKHPVILLDRGYSHFCFLYPIHCSSISIISSKSFTPNIVNLENVEYPFLNDDNHLEQEKIVIKIDPEPVIDENIENQLNELNIIKTKEEIEVISPPKIDRSKKPPSIVNQPLEENIPPPPIVPEEKSEEMRIPRRVPTYDRATKPRVKMPAKVPRMVQPSEFELPVLTDYGHIPGRSPRKNSVGSRLTGFSNDRNFCYINSVVQALLHIKIFRDFFLEHKFLTDLNRPPMSKQGAISLEMAALMEFYWLGNYTVLHLRKLKALMGLRYNRFKDSNQEDSHEFYTALLEALHEELAYNEEPPVPANDCVTQYYAYLKNKPSFIYEQFFGMANLRINCLNCKDQQDVLSLSGCISVDVKAKYLTDCMVQAYEPEYVNTYKCEKCHVRMGATFKPYIVTPPKILVVHIKRFQLDSSCRDYVKNEKEVVFDTVFKLPPIMHNEKDVYHYQLSAVCIHNGTLTSGHYQTIALDPRTNRWVKFNDSSADFIDDVTNVRGIFSQAYILFYEQVTKT